MKCKVFMASMAALSMVACSSNPVAESAVVDKPLLESVEQRLSYMVGSKIAKQFALDGFDLDFISLKLGLDDTMASKQSRLSEKQMEDTILALQEIKSRRQAEGQGITTEQNQIASDAYLVVNAAKEGVVTTASGLQYKEIVAGDGEKPELGDDVVVHYKGMLTDGTVFDSSYARNEPSGFPVAGLIPGWVEALQLMNVGDRWEVTIPSHLAYGEQGAGQKIGPNTTLVFDIELLNIIKP